MNLIMLLLEKRFVKNTRIFGDVADLVRQLLIRQIVVLMKNRPARPKFLLCDKYIILKMNHFKQYF